MQIDHVSDNCYNTVDLDPCRHTHSLTQAHARTRNCYAG